MASSRRTSTNETVNTYGNETRDYQVGELSVWESATDVNLVATTTSYTLECYADSASYDDSIFLAGATTNASYFRIVRAASGNECSGTPSSGFKFVSSPTVIFHLFSLGENFSCVEDIEILVTGNASAATNCIYTNRDSNTVTGCLLKATNVGAGGAHGLYATLGAGESLAVYNTIAYECTTANFYFYGSDSGETVKAYNCTSTDGAGRGFWDVGGGIVVIFYGCGSNGNATSQFEGGTQVNCSSSAPTFVNAAGDDYHLAAADSVWKDADANTGDWHAACGYDDDIDKDTRTGSWDIGADESTVVGGRTRRFITKDFTIPFSTFILACGIKNLSRRDFMKIFPWVLRK